MSRRATSLVMFAAFFSLATAPLPAQAPSEEVPPFSVKVTGHGQPMILIPGLESSGAVWDGTVAHYAAAYQCHVLTLAGFAGQPPSPATPFLTSVRDAVATYIRRERLKTPVLVGHSLGGVLALSIAARYPDLVGKIVTIDGPPAPGVAENPNATPDQLKAIAEQAAASFVKMDRATREQMLLKVMVTNPEHLKLMRSWGPSDPETVRRALAEIITTDLRSDVARIQTPILVVGTWVSHGPGADSASVARTFTDQFSQAKSWQLEMAPKARHFVMYDDPDWLFAKMDAFLAQSAAFNESTLHVQPRVPSSTEPFAGFAKWKLNVARSSFGETTLAFDRAASGEMQMTYLGRSYRFRVDGNDYPAILGMTAAWKQIDPNTWEAVYKRSGNVWTTDTTRLSSDGKTLTINSKGITPAGGTMEHTTVYERVSGSSGLIGTWKTKSAPPVASTALELAPSGADGLIITRPDGSCDAKFDGNDYPAHGPSVPPGVTWAIRRTGPRSFDWTTKLNGDVFGETSFTVSDNGQTLTGIGGRAADSQKTKMVFDRVEIR